MKEFIKNFLKNNSFDKDIDEDIDLVEEGILDSLMIFNLLTEIELKLDKKIDIEKLLKLDKITINALEKVIKNA